MMEKTILWLAGLLSTDGVVKNSSKSKGLAFCIYSSEKDWLEIILERIKEIGLSGIIREVTRKGSLAKKRKYYLWLHNPRKIALLFEKYHAEKFFNPRKMRIIKIALKYYKNNKNRSRYSEEEKKILKENYHLSNKELAKLLEDRDEQSVYYHKRYLDSKENVKSSKIKS